MAIAFRSASTFNGSYYGEDPSINAPAGLADGDLIIVIFISSTTNAGGAPLAGWTLLAVQNQASTATLFVLYKIAVSEGASWTFTGLFPGSENYTGVALAYTGVNGTTPLDVTSVTGDLGTITNPTDTSAITPTSDNCMILSIFAADTTATVTGTPDADPACTERADLDGTTYTLWIYAQDHLQTSAAAEAHTVTPSATNGICYKLLALRPAAAGGGVGGTDIYLRPGHATPEDIILRDPTQSDSTTKALDGVIAASSTLSASLSLTVPLDGAIAATSVLSASLSLTVPLAGAVAATSTLTAELTVVPAGVNLDGVIAATSALTAALSLSKPLDGAIAGTGALTASLSLAKPLAGAIDAVSTLSAALSLSIPLSGVLPAASALSADLSLTKPLAGTTAATSALVASLSLSKPLDGAVSATSALTATLSLTVPLAGLLPGVSTLTGELTVVGFGVNLDGVISATSALTATLTVEMAVFGYVRLVTPAQPYLPLLSLARAHHDLPATAEAAKTIYTGADTALHLTCPPIGGHSWS